MLIKGADALPAFRKRRLLEALRDVRPDIVDLRARYLHYLDGAPDATECAILRHLFAYAPEAQEQDPPSGSPTPTLVVVPRPGTVSPWSSKASDIVRGCGVAGVRRVERGIAWTADVAEPLDARAHAALAQQIAPWLHDRMTEAYFLDPELSARLFSEAPPRPLGRICARPLRVGLAEANRSLGLALSEAELGHLEAAYERLERVPTDVELMTFAQVNSEHCRHKTFNARWRIDGKCEPHSLFDMIRHTHRVSPGGVLSAYSDNCAVTRGWPAVSFLPDPTAAHAYVERSTHHHLAVKVETHNHPTAISPFPGAATGAGGEIRDEAATGRGARSKAALTGFSVSNLQIPGHRHTWEIAHGRPDRIASALEIMLEGPIGAAGYNNEFGRPALLGYFRSLEQTVAGQRFGYHKPIMIAGGLGNVLPENVTKAVVRPGMPIVVLGGPAMLIGLGGGAASSVASGHGDAELDFASVQRGNAEMQRRCQQVIDACWAEGHGNPIVSIHDVGAGGLSNAVPEIVDTDGLGACLSLRAVPSADPAMSPLELWCNEAQERYVLALDGSALADFAEICARERCPYAVIGEASADGRLTLHDALLEADAIDLDMQVLLGATPGMLRDVARRATGGEPFDYHGIDVVEAALAVLDTPTVGDKSFLITIGDRTVGGLVSRDQMVGRHQVPVADCAVTLSDFKGYTGEAMAMGERTPLAMFDAPASGRMAVAEALTNLAGAPVGALANVVLSANWMAACDHPGQDAALFDTVRAVALELCPALDLRIPVGKDSLSMKTVWTAGDERREVIAPISLIVSAFAPVSDVRRALSPVLALPAEPTSLVFVDLALGRQRLGASILAQVQGALGASVPDLESPGALVAFFTTLQALMERGSALAYHDRSDGGLLTTLAEMCFAGGVGVEVDLSPLGGDGIAALFCEELGAVVQVADAQLDAVLAAFRAAPALADHVHVIGRPTAARRLRAVAGAGALLDIELHRLRRAWSSTSHAMARLRDHPACADEALAQALDADDPGLTAARVPAQAPSAAAVRVTRPPRVAVLREQGVNGHTEMAAAFHAAGFEAVDVHMSDIQRGRLDLAGFQMLAACGGFSYGDVLGGGGGWAGSIRFNPRARAAFAAFFERDDTLTLGVCNGCQMLAQLADLIPGAEHWPRFMPNRSRQFEARLSLVEVVPSGSLLLKGMEGARLPVPVAHGEGYAAFPGDAEVRAESERRVCLRFVDGHGAVATRYPANPNGLPGGITGLTSGDGRVTIMMPHPERAFRTVQLSWQPPGFGAASPWQQMFANAAAWALDRRR